MWDSTQTYVKYQEAITPKEPTVILGYDYGPIHLHDEMQLSWICVFNDNCKNKLVSVCVFDIIFADNELLLLALV